MGLLMSFGELLGGEMKSRPVTIKGVVTNFAEAKGWIPSDAYLQLVLHVSPKGRLDVTVTHTSRGVTMSSSLPKTSMPEAGSTWAFSFDCKDLDDGTYVIAVQLAATAANRPVLVQRGQQTLEIRVSKRTGPTLDVGDVTIPAP
jgi:hypothetical protein